MGVSGGQDVPWALWEARSSGLDATGLLRTTVLLAEQGLPCPGPVGCLARDSRGPWERSGRGPAPQAGVQRWGDRRRELLPEPDTGLFKPLQPWALQLPRHLLGPGHSLPSADTPGTRASRVTAPLRAQRSCVSEELWLCYCRRGVGTSPQAGLSPFGEGFGFAPQCLLFSLDGSFTTSVRRFSGQNAEDGEQPQRP